VAFPHITSAFNVSIVLASWVLSANLLGTVATAPLLGKASDSFGRKRTYIFFVVLFMVGTLLSAIAPNIYLLIMARTIQGIGSGGLIPASAGIVAEAFPHSRQRYIGFITTIVTAGGILGPNVGGWIVETFGWRAVFWLALPWAAATLFALALILKPDKKRTRLDVDLKGAGLFAGSLLCVMAGITVLGNGGKEGFWWAPGGLLVLAGSLLLFFFFHHEKKVAMPMLDPVILTGKPYNAANIYNIIIGVNFGVSALLPLYAVSVYGMSTLQSGLAITPRSVGLAAASLVSSFFLLRFGYRKPMVLGSLLVALAGLLLGLGALDFPMSHSTRLALLLVVIGLSGVGLGICVPAANNACIELMPEQISTITGLRQTFRNLGAAVSISITSVVLHLSSSVGLGFAFAFWGTALLMLLAMPAIYAMPRSARDTPSKACPPSTGAYSGSSPGNS